MHSLLQNDIEAEESSLGFMERTLTEISTATGTLKAIRRRTLQGISPGQSVEKLKPLVTHPSVSTIQPMTLHQGLHRDIVGMASVESIPQALQYLGREDPPHGMAGPYMNVGGKDKTKDLFGIAERPIMITGASNPGSPNSRPTQQYFHNRKAASTHVAQQKGGLGAPAVTSPNSHSRRTPIHSGRDKIKDKDIATVLLRNSCKENGKGADRLTFGKGSKATGVDRPAMKTESNSRTGSPLLKYDIKNSNHKPKPAKFEDIGNRQDMQQSDATLRRKRSIDIAISMNMNVVKAMTVQMNRMPSPKEKLSLAMEGFRSSPKGFLQLKSPLSTLTSKNAEISAGMMGEDRISDGEFAVKKPQMAELIQRTQQLSPILKAVLSPVAGRGSHKIILEKDLSEITKKGNHRTKTITNISGQNAHEDPLSPGHCPSSINHCKHISFHKVI